MLAGCAGCLLIAFYSPLVHDTDAVAGHGSFDPDLVDDHAAKHHVHQPFDGASAHHFAPHSYFPPRPRISVPPLPAFPTRREPQSALERLHDAWSTAMYSRLRRADNARFIEHFRYIIVASQLLNEYLDQGCLPSETVPSSGFSSTTDGSGVPSVSTSLYGAAATATVAFALVFLLHWARPTRSGYLSKSKTALALITFTVVGIVGYAYIRRQWLKFLRRNAVGAASSLTTNWQAFELASSSALSFIQEVELVSKGYRLSTPLPPASRIEDHGASRRCARLRRVLHKAYATLVPASQQACTSLRTLVDEDTLEKYLEVYDLSPQDAKEASGADAILGSEADPESLKALRVLSYHFGILRRLTFCSLMALEADGGKPDFSRWRIATEIMSNLSESTRTSTERVRQILSEMETLKIPTTPGKGASPTPAKDRLRTQVRKISNLSSGIRGLQAKMQILREETSRSIERSEDLTDLGPNMMAQYESIGADLKELMQAWETGKASLQSNINKQEQRISLASSGSGLRSPVSSLGGLTAVEENEPSGSPADALRMLTGDREKSTSSSMATTPSDEEMVFEAIAMPRQRSNTLTREERIARMHEERERQATLRAKRDANTSMLRELESVINLRPSKRLSSHNDSSKPGQEKIALH